MSRIKTLALISLPTVATTLVALVALALLSGNENLPLSDGEADRSQPTSPPSPTTPQPPTSTPTPNDSKSPKGKIVYTCQIFRDRQYNQICLMDADGSNPRRMTTDDRSDHLFASLAPDGQSFVFSSNQNGEGYEVYEMDLLGNQRQLTSLKNAFAPEISPDGSKIVFTYDEDAYPMIWVMGRDGNNPHPLTTYREIDAWDPVWSPDGSHILFASDRPGAVQLFVMKEDGSEIRQVTEVEGLRGRSDWAPDGLTLASYAGKRWDREIVLFRLNGDAVRTITQGGNNLAPSFSPDGEWISFTSYMDRYRDDSGCEIYIMRLDGSEITRLTDNDYCDWQPRWGP